MGIASSVYMTVKTGGRDTGLGRRLASGESCFLEGMHVPWKDLGLQDCC